MTPTEQAIIKAIENGYTTAVSIVRVTKIDRLVVADALASLDNAGIIEWISRKPYRDHGDFAIVKDKTGIRTKGK